MNLNGKVALIAGGTGALGRAVVSEFLRRGARVASSYILEHEAEAMSGLMEAHKPNLILVVADVTKPDAAAYLMNRTASEFGGIHILVNLVGGFAYGRVADTDEKTWDRMMSINLKSAFLCARAALPLMTAQNYGRIVNVSSRPALKGSAGVGAYGASKAGVMNLTEALADETRDFDINVNAILPGTIDTPQNRRDMPDADFSKWVGPEAIAKVIAFLASDDSKPINGASIPVYGKS
ncbi:MAG: SDR family oxidoreductase [Deltaproteobacteria bacterium]